MKPNARVDGEVVDASAALAYLQQEPGYEVVGSAIRRRAVISAVNLAEVHSTLREQELASDRLVARLRAMGLQVASFDASDSAIVGALRLPTKPLGLSLGDRACLALALRLEACVMTSDRALAEADVGVDVVLIR